MNGNTSRFHLGKGTDSVLTGKQRWVFSNLKIKIHRFVCESRKLIAEAKFVCPISGGSEGETVVLFLHLLVQHLTVRVFQSTIYIVVTTSDHLELQGALGALSDVLVEALLGIVGQLKGDLGGAARARQQQQPPQQRKQPASPTARCGRPARRQRRPRHHPGSAAASTELRGLDARSRPGPRRPASLSDTCDGERARASEEKR